MKVAVTYGEDEMVFQHFGHTERFKIYTVEDGKVLSGEVVDTAGAGLWPPSSPSRAWTPSSAAA